MKSEGKAYVYTIGCQMNVYDSERIIGDLLSLGYKEAVSEEDADIVICNTCTIRKKAQEKAYSFLGRFAKKKASKPHLITVMAGCVAQQEGDNAFKRLPHLDIVLGTGAFPRLPEHIKEIQSGRSQITDTQSRSFIYNTMPLLSANKRKAVSQFVTIMQGCENYCTYCVVPYVRGKERSRPPETILEEIRILADQGVKEVTLLGQNVNSYGIKENDIPFFKLLEKVDAIHAIKRIRFATSHPKDLSDDLIRAIRDLEKVCMHLHLPVQSGSDRILKKMNRGYTRSRYLERISELKRQCPEISLTTDLIVGFPSEEQSDFNLTLDLMKTVAFDNLFAFSYSDRKVAPASQFSNKVDVREKRERLNELLNVQSYYTEKSNKKLMGKTVSVLVEGESPKKRSFSDTLPVTGAEKGLEQMTGRTESNKIVHFLENRNKIGHIVDLKIEETYLNSLWGGSSRN